MSPMAGTPADLSRLYELLELRETDESVVFPLPSCCGVDRLQLSTEAQRCRERARERELELQAQREAEAKAREEEEAPLATHDEEATGPGNTDDAGTYADEPMEVESSEAVAMQQSVSVFDFPSDDEVAPVTTIRLHQKSRRQAPKSKCTRFLDPHTSLDSVASLAAWCWSVKLASYPIARLCTDMFSFSERDRPRATLSRALKHW